MSNTANNTPAQDALLDAAAMQFSRHGFAKTSMSDIAAAAGVSRTSLYKYFKTKEEVFRAISARIADRMELAAKDAAAAPGDLETRLLAVINARVRWVYDLLRKSAHGRELIDERNRICGEQALAANDRFVSLVAGLIADGVDKPRRAEAGEAAAVLVNAVNGVLERAGSEADAEAGVALLVSAFARGLQAK